MEIRQFRVVVRARDFARTCRFYEETLALPKIQHWDHEKGSGAVYQAGGGMIEILGRPREAASRDRDEAFDYQGPDHKLTITLVVPSAEQAYEELIFRDRNIPGGLKHDPDGTLVFQTHDPDGVKIVYREG